MYVMVRRLIAGTFLCSWWPYFDFFLANISIFNLVNIAVDRWQQTRVVTRVATWTRAPGTAQSADPSSTASSGRGAPASSAASPGRGAASCPCPSSR